MGDRNPLDSAMDNVVGTYDAYEKLIGKNKAIPAGTERLSLTQYADKLSTMSNKQLADEYKRVGTSNANREHFMKALDKINPTEGA